MTITFSCSNCRKSVSTPDAMAGKKGKCPTCGSIIEIPAAGSAPGFSGGSAATQPFGNSAIPSNNPLDDLGSFSSAMSSSRGLPPATSTTPFGQGPNPYAAPSQPSPFGNYQGGSGSTAQAWPIVVPASIQLAGNVFSILWCFIRIGLLVAFGNSIVDDGNPLVPKKENYVMTETLGIIFMGTCTIVATVGTVCMLRRKWHGMAVTGAVLSMLGCACIFFPVGLWSLIVLCMGDYKRQFT